LKIIMQLHEVKPKKKQRVAKRIGRGGKKGTYSGRGMKGQKSRAGFRIQPRVREMLKKYPKMRGYRRSGRKKAISVNLATLEKSFAKGETVNPGVLAQKKIVRSVKGRSFAVKILGDGQIIKALIVENCTVSQSAKEKIEKVGGTVSSI